MFFSKIVLFAISLGVLASPHTPLHPVLYRRGVGARVARNVTAVKRQDNSKCKQQSPAVDSNIPARIAAPHPTITSEHSTSTLQLPPTTTPTKPTLQPPQQGCPPFTIDGTHRGDGTYFADGLGACGDVNVDSDSIVALGHCMFDLKAVGGNSNNNKFCHQKVSITGPNGNTVTATVEDRCAACQPYDLDMTTSLFSQLAPIAKGRINISWAFIG